MRRCTTCCAHLQCTWPAPAALPCYTPNCMPACSKLPDATATWQGSVYPTHTYNSWQIMAPYPTACALEGTTTCSSYCMVHPLNLLVLVVTSGLLSCLLRLRLVRSMTCECESAGADYAVYAYMHSATVHGAPCIIVKGHTPHACCTHCCGTLHHTPQKITQTKLHTRSAVRACISACYIVLVILAAHTAY